MGQGTRECFLICERSVAVILSTCTLQPQKDLVLSCDTSPYGLGAVLSHVMEDCLEKQVSYASRTLTKAERNYAQVDKEALAVVFPIKKFHQFLYSRHFRIYTNHKPLLGLLGGQKGIPLTANTRSI